MAVDTSIYSNLLRPPKSPEEYAAERQSNEANKLSLLLQRGQYDQQQRSVAEDAAFRTALGQGGDYNDPTVQSRLMQASPTRGMAFIKGQLDANKVKADTLESQRKAEKDRLAIARDQIELIGQVAGSSKDQASYSQGLQLLKAQGIDISSIPEQFDPRYVSQALNQALTAKDQLEQVWKAKEFDLDTQKFGETVRNNKAQNSVAQGNLAVAQGNLGVSRQRLNFDQQQPKGQYDAKRGVMVDPRTGVATPVTMDGKPISSDAGGKPLPVGALKMQQEALDAIGTASGINADISAIKNQISTGKLDLSPVNNAMGGALNAFGISTEGSRNLASFKNTMEKLRNDSLRLNKGVQTEGDAQRAWNELITNINDPQVVSQRLDEIARINERAVALHEMAVNTIRQNYGAEPLDTASRANLPAAVGAPAPAAVPAQTKPGQAKPSARTVVRTGNLGGRKVIQYSDGTTEYADQSK